MAQRTGTGRGTAARAARAGAGVLAGAATAAAGALWLAAALPLSAGLAWPRTRPAARAWLAAGTARLISWERLRLESLLGCTVDPAPRTGRGLAYLGLRAAVTALAAPLLASVLGVAGLLLGGSLFEAATGTVTTVSLALPWVSVSTPSITMGLAVSLLLLLAAAAAAAGLAALDRVAARRLLGPSTADLLALRVAELTATRAGVLRAIDAERRRIERDLHDGVQQRVVALAMLLARARRAGDTERAAHLLEQAHRESQRVAAELREVAWKVYPTALDELGLHAALRGVAERSALPVALHYAVERDLAPEVETAVYFVAREAITNAAKHARAHRVEVAVRTTAAGVELSVRDDGVGGADAGGGGLVGLARRVAALDGRLEVSSPAGGPTLITAHLPAPARQEG
ncbi:sensor histidine kinase [Streptomonospora nanhaiensis]|uniref:histidine kinase n=3 Tax=Streptomonospora nanhaiensis TaxID=1323731 RepID=A0A853BFV0_9ACTN|nr:histidine kinase [Streptomonospora nanhaiensis]NYI94348.1 signal transduction histidine kinase [Streptomonospora nanhaiensis]